MAGGAQDRMAGCPFSSLCGAEPVSVREASGRLPAMSCSEILSALLTDFS